MCTSVASVWRWSHPGMMRWWRPSAVVVIGCANSRLSSPRSGCTSSTARSCHHAPLHCRHEGDPAKTLIAAALIALVLSWVWTPWVAVITLARLLPGCSFSSCSARTTPPPRYCANRNRSDRSFDDAMAIIRARLKEGEQSLRDRDAEIAQRKQITNAVPDGLFLLDNGGRIIWCNQAGAGDALARRLPRHGQAHRPADSRPGFAAISTMTPAGAGGDARRSLDRISSSAAAGARLLF